MVKTELLTLRTEDSYDTVDTANSAVIELLNKRIMDRSISGNEVVNVHILQFRTVQTRMHFDELAFELDTCQYDYKLEYFGEVTVILVVNE